MRTQVSNHLREKVTLEQKFRELTIWHHCLLGFTSWFFVFTFWGDVLLSYGHIAARSEGREGFSNQILIYAVIVGLFFGGYFLPIFFAGWGIAQTWDYFKNYWYRDSLFKKGMLIIGWMICMVTLVFLPLVPFFIVDILFPFSAAPFATVISGAICIVFAYSFTQGVTFKWRVISLCLILLSILSVKYLDIASSKPFVRDLYQIKRGMSGLQVEKIMEDHRKNPALPEEDYFLHLTPDYTGSASFRPQRGGELGIIRFQKGRVTKVEFIGD